MCPSVASLNSKRLLDVMEFHADILNAVEHGIYDQIHTVKNIQSRIFESESSSQALNIPTVTAPCMSSVTVI
jgi:hypothetical protein